MQYLIMHAILSYKYVFVCIKLCILIKIVLVELGKLFKTIIKHTKAKFKNKK